MCESLKTSLFTNLYILNIVFLPHYRLCHLTELRLYYPWPFFRLGFSKVLSFCTHTHSQHYSKSLYIEILFDWILSCEGRVTAPIFKWFGQFRSYTLNTTYISQLRHRQLKVLSDTPNCYFHWTVVLRSAWMTVLWQKPHKLRFVPFLTFID